MTPALVVIAKAPVEGRVKTRLCPPCTPAQAATLAGAALADTLDAAEAAPVARRVLALEGEPGEWVPDGWEVFPQRGDGLAERLAAAFVDTAQPALLIGMDTPQVTTKLLVEGLARLQEPGVDAVFGAAADGGFWAIGLRRPDPAVFAGVPMSSSWTGRVQRARLDELGLACAELPVLRDVDRMADARAVARLAPGSRFARALSAMNDVAVAR